MDVMDKVEGKVDSKNEIKVRKDLRKVFEAGERAKRIDRYSSWVTLTEPDTDGKQEKCAEKGRKEKGKRGTRTKGRGKGS